MPAPPPDHRHGSREQASSGIWEEEEAPEVNDAPSAVPLADRQQHAALEKFYGKLKVRGST